MMDELYLQHHGIIGQKWGIRRYQNYDGTYTQQGMQRYRAAENAYKDAKETNRMAKALAKRNGFSVDPKVLAEASSDERKKKTAYDKAYRDLKIAKQRDKGKRLYEKGDSIELTDYKRRKVNRILKGIASLSAGAVLYRGQYEYRGLDKTNKILLAIGGASVAAAGINDIASARKTKLMREYWHRRGTK